MKKILQKVIENNSLKITDVHIKDSPFISSLIESSEGNIDKFILALSSIIQKDNFSEYTIVSDFLSTDIQYLKGVGPKRSVVFKSRGLDTVESILKILPASYRDFSKLDNITNVSVGDYALLKVQFKTFKEVFYNRRKVLEAIFYDSSTEIILKWFNFKLPYLKKYFNKDKTFIVYGKIGIYRGTKEIVHPIIEETTEFKQRIVPIYPVIGKIKSKIIENIILNVFDKLQGKNYEYLPASILVKRKFNDILKCYHNIHSPAKADEDFIRNNLKRLIYDEFFFVMLAVSKEKLKKDVLKTEPVKYKGFIISPFLKNLPFELTGSQKKVLREILSDFEKGKVLNRLLQGDVGSGKTLVALVTALMVIENKGQVAFMVPTEVLAEQHYRNFLKYELPVNIALLTGNTLKKQREDIFKQLGNGDLDLIIGTHALIEENVIFKNLKLNIIDEQHKFGVRQRLVLKEKGNRVHTLIMTATPIPRTLTLTLYGDLDVSVIDKLPPGRKPVRTYWFRENKRSLLVRKIEEVLDKGYQAYFIYPLIDESEKLDLKSVVEMEKQIRSEFSDKYSIKILHGKMKSSEKDMIMKEFASGSINILISTTVIEVGIDVPNATVIVIENAERFGLSQLHQLRGRVGRGTEQSYCFLVSKNRLSKDASERLKVMTETTDGFKIADADLRIRGGGEIAGTKQSGIAEFQFADLVRDFKILTDAKEDAEKLIRFDSELEKFPALKDKFEKFMGRKAALVTTG